MSTVTHPDFIAAAGGDDAALATLVRLYHDRVYRFGLRVCRDGFDADDAVQDAFIKLSQRPEVIAHGGALSWLLRVVVNACRRALRPFARERRSLGERVDADDASDVSANTLSPEAALQRWELVSAVHAAIAELEAPYREVLVLRDLEGLSGEEASAMLGVPLATMKTRLHRARVMLREKIQRTPT